MTTYSRDEVVSALTSYYELLVAFYIPTSELVYPPASGWPGITKARFAFLGKTDTVIDLLRHIPYIRRDDMGDPYQITEACAAIDYRGGYTEMLLSPPTSAGEFEPDPDTETALPPHVVTLAATAEGRNGFYLFIDTKKGTITTWGQMWETAPTALSHKMPKGSKENWCEQGTYPIADYFEAQMRSVRNLDVLPVTENMLKSPDENDPVGKRMKKVFRAHGWPSVDFQQAACLEKVNKLYREEW